MSPKSTGRRGPNEGSIYQRKDGRWVASVNLGWADGKRQRKHFIGHTRREVQDKLTAALSDLAKGLPVKLERQKVEQFLENWLEEAVKPSVRPKTFSSYTQLVRKHIIPIIGHLQLAELGPQHIESLLNKKRRSGLSDRTVQYIYTIVRCALTRAFKWGLVARNVATLIDRPRAAKPPIKPLDPDQARILLSAIKGERLEALYVVALAEGLRQGEILGMQWRNLDLNDGSLTVRGALQRVNSKLQLVEPKTRSSRRTISLSEITVSALRQHRVKQLEERLAAGSEWRGNSLDLVFTTSIGTPLEPSGVVKQFKRILREAGLPEQRFHDLRHACASLMLANGVHPRVVMEKLGHSEISLTMNTYTHPIPQLQKDAARRMDDLLSG